MRPINVLHLRDTDEIGGPGKTILETFRAIDPTRFSLHVGVFLTRHERGDSPFVRAAKDNGMPVHYIRGFNQYDPRMIWRVIDLVKAHGIDILHAHETKSDVIAYLASRLHNVRIVTTMHGWITNSAKRRFYIGIDKRLARRFDRVIAVSGMIRDELSAAGVPPEALRLLHNAIVVDRYQPSRGDGFLAQLIGTPLVRPVISSIGRFSPEKGHVDLIDALGLVARRGFSFSAVLAGDGPERPRLVERIRQHGLEKTVHLPGYVNGAERILEETDLMVLPSHTEGLPNVALEALAMEVPVLATRVGGTPEVIVDGETGRLVPPHSPEALADALQDFLTDTAPWRSLASRGRDVVLRRFDFTARTRRLASLYSELLSETTFLIYYGLLVFFVLEYVRPASYVPAIAAFRVNFLIFWSVMLAALVSKDRVSNGEVFRTGNTVILLVLLGLIAISVLIADITEYSFYRFRAVLEYVIVFWAISKHITDVRRMKGIFKALVAVHIIVTLLSPQLLTSQERQYLSAGSFLGDSNDFALSVNVTIPLCLFLLLDAPKMRQRLFYAALLLFSIVVVVKTQSRGGFVALVCVGIYYWLKSDRKLLMMGLAGVAVAAVLAFAPASYFDRINTISTYEEDGSAQGRISAWKGGLNMALANPIFGVGAGNFPHHSTRYAPAGAPVRWMTAHSIYFLILGELGFPGLLVLLVFLVHNFTANRRLLKELKSRSSPEAATDARLLACLSASLLAFATGGAFLSAVYYPHMYILAGLLAASRRMVADRGVEVAPAVPVSPVHSRPPLTIPKPARARLAGTPLPVASPRRRSSR